jgi:sulfopyruvate decarboxylase subunit beta
MKRFDCLKAIAGKVGDALVVGSAGGATTEWYHLHPSEGNFRSRTLGLASSIGVGVALGLPHRKVIVLDGDGSLLMNLCGLPTAAWAAPKNLIHIVFDNGVYESSGSSATATSGRTDLVAVAKAAGFPRALWATDVDSFARAVADALAGDELTFIGAKVQHGIVPRHLVDNHGRYRKQISLHPAHREARRPRDIRGELSRPLEVPE